MAMTLKVRNQMIKKWIYINIKEKSGFYTLCWYLQTWDMKVVQSSLLFKIFLSFHLSRFSFYINIRLRLQPFHFSALVLDIIDSWDLSILSINWLITVNFLSVLTFSFPFAMDLSTKKYFKSLAFKQFTSTADESHIVG